MPPTCHIIAIIININVIMVIVVQQCIFIKNLARDQEQSYGLQAALASEPEELFIVFIVKIIIIVIIIVIIIIINNLVKDQEQSYGLQAALASELEELLIHQEVPVEVMVPMPAVPSLDSS